MSETGKAELRRRLIDIRNSIPAAKREEKSRKIKEAVLAMPEIREADTVFVYVSFGSEVSTRDLIEELLSMGKHVGVPLCNTDTHTMSVIEITDFTQLKEGHYGIPEPDRKLIDDGVLREITKEEISIAVIPAAAFDSDGYRMGYGGGYYDRFLDGFRGKSLGLAFLECAVRRLPREEHDMAADAVITD